MRLKKIEICGFKSFRDKVALELSSGITAIVGPNGCGKSNIVDAIRWAMGEQRVKSLRSQSMEEVIFNGSEEAEPVSLAEVSLVLSGEDNPFPGSYVDCSEVMITRRLFRGGENEYFINKARVRQLDVREFFMGTGAGAKSYSLVEQNSVTLMVESKPEDIRHYIEEAAGISKYKSRREVASRKLVATRENLVRLTDIIQEVKKGLNATARQAKRAEQFRKLRQEIKEGELALAINAYGVLSSQRAELAAVVESARKEEMRLKTELVSVEASLEDIKDQIQEHERTVLQHQESIYRIKSALNIKEQEIAFTRSKIVELSARKERLQVELIELEERQTKMAEELGRLAISIEEGAEKLQILKEAVYRRDHELNKRRGELKEVQSKTEEKRLRLFDLAQERTRLNNNLVHLARSINEWEKRLERIKKEEEDYQSHLDELEARCQRLGSSVAERERELFSIREGKKALQQETELARDSLTELEETINSLKLKKGQKAERLKSLQEFRDSYSWLNDGPRALMKIFHSGQAVKLEGMSFLGILADLIEVPKELETAVEVALGDRLQYIAVRTQRDALEGIGYLKSLGRGRGSFIPLDIKPSASHQYPEEYKDAVRLVDLIKFREDFREVGEYLLGDVVLTNKIEMGLNLWRQNGTRCTFVTPEGDLISPEGVIAGGYAGGGQGNILKSRREITELESELQAVNMELERAMAERSKNMAVLQRWNDELAELRSREHQLELGLNGQKKDLERYRDELKRSKKQLSLVGINKQELESELSAAKARMEELHSLVSEKKTQEELLAEEYEGWRKRGSALLNEMQEEERGLLEEKLRMTSCHEQRQADIKTKSRVEVMLSELRSQREAKAKEADQWQVKAVESSRAIAEKEDEIRSLIQDLEKEESRLMQRKTELGKLEESQHAVQMRTGKLKNLLQSATKEVGEKELAFRETTLQLEALQKVLTEKFQVDFSGLERDINILPAEEIERLEDDLKKKKETLESFGEVNLLALEEYERYKERYDFLVLQTEDLKKSIDSLQKTISRINQATRRRFSESFAAINENFTEVFALIFPGGRGKLRLTDEADLLATGVDMDIQVPGKRVQSLALLSGGEKTLAAIALIFSMIKYRPAPFLVLDEVDAALDDNNIALFNRLVQDIAAKSQVILVTHNKLTMEVADYLYGVTMQKRGISSVISVSLQ